MRRLFVLALFLLLPAWGTSGGGLTCPKGYVGGGLTPCTPAYAFFEFAPASGAGMGAACACAAVTGAKGEALTFTRASAGTCTKSNTTTNINNGDLVVCSTNQPRVMPGGDGSGGLGLLVESTRTNLNIWGGDWSNPAYSSLTAGGAGSIVVTANAGTSPDNSLTAAQLDLPLTNAGQASVRMQAAAAGCATVACAYSVYVRGVSGSGSTDMGSWGSGAVNQPITFTNTAWTRGCLLATNPGTPGVFVGNDTRDNGGVIRPAQSIYVAFGQVEIGPYCTSYIPTTTIAASRATENASINASGWGSTATISWASTWVGPTPVSGSAATALEFTGLVSLFNEAGGQMRWYTGTAQAVAIASTTAGLRWFAWHDGANKGMAFGPNATSGADVSAANKFGANLYIGGSSGVPPNGVLKQVCVDPSPERCR